MAVAFVVCFFWLNGCAAGVEPGMAKNILVNKDDEPGTNRHN